MLSFVNKYGRNYTYSQNGEEGILIEALNRMGLCSGKTVEIGGSDGYFCSNTALLLERGFSGSFVESDWNFYQKCKENWSHRKDVKCICSTVDGNNINAFVKDDCDVLSTDTDGADFQIFEGLKAKPKIVIVEIDSSLDPNFSSFNSDGGASYFAMLLLGVTKGYFLLAHTGNMVFVANEYRDLFPEITADPITEIDQYFNRSWLKEEAA